MLMIVNPAHISTNTSRSTGFTPVNRSPLLRRKSTRLAGFELKSHRTKGRLGLGGDGGGEVVQGGEDGDGEMDEESDEADQVRIRTPPEKGTWSGFL